MAIQYFATNRKRGDGSTTVWDFAFAGPRPDAGNGTEPYLTDDTVKVATVELTESGEELRTDLAFEFGPGPAQVTITPAIADGVDFVIYRETPSETPVADFTDYTSIDEQDLDNSFRQVLYVVQEMRDRLEDGSALAVQASDTAFEALGIADDADNKADNALAEAGSATQVANTALGRSNAAISTADAAADLAADASSTANEALGASSTAVDTANAASDAANAAVGTANSASSTANAASNVANAANSTANSADSKADDALAASGVAVTQAGQAVQTANSAAQTATGADSKADQAISDSSLVTGFQDQLDDIVATIQDLTGEDIGAITLNTDNLEFLTDKAAARANLEVMSTVQTADMITTVVGGVSQDLDIHKVSDDHDDRYTRRANNLSDLADPATARVNLGLGTSAVAGSTASRTSESTTLLLQAAAMNDHRLSSDHDSRYTRRSNNLSDLNDSAAARDNLGLGSAATQPDSRYLVVGDNGTVYLDKVVGGLDIRTKDNDAPYILQVKSSGNAARLTVTHNAKELASSITDGDWRIDGDLVYHEGNQLALGTSAATARSNLGLGSAAQQNTSAFSPSNHNHDSRYPLADNVEAVGFESNNKDRPYFRSTDGVWHLQRALGYTPIEQGGGSFQSNNKVRIGWSDAGELRAQVDGLDLGKIWTDHKSGGASSEAGAVGTYALLRLHGSGSLQVSAGALRSGGGLIPSAAGGNAIASPVPGTWRCMGGATTYTSDVSNEVTLWVRVS